MSQASLRDGGVPLGVGIWTERSAGEHLRAQPPPRFVRLQSKGRRALSDCAMIFSDRPLPRAADPRAGRDRPCAFVPNGAVLPSVGCTRSGRAQALKRAHTRVHVDLTEGRLP